jgi:predicted dehydrogenase
MGDGPLRIGILGAARIAPMALIKPAQRNLEAAVVGVAARDARRAASFAAKHGIERVYTGYDELLADPAIEAVYNPLPNSHHARWTIRALEAGKHVLCEKPFSATVAEAEAMAAAATRTGRVLMEAFHYRYHPLFARMRAIIAAGEIGTVQRFEATFCIPLLRAGDIRWSRDLAGGALMDTGCYAVHLLRHLAQSEPEVRSARAKWTSGGVDRWLTAELAFPTGAQGAPHVRTPPAEAHQHRRARRRQRGPDRRHQLRRAAVLPPTSRADRPRAARRAGGGLTELRLPAARVRRRRSGTAPPYRPDRPTRSRTCG